MKKYTKNAKYAFCGTLLIVVSSCSNLQEKPDFINPDSFYKSAVELQLGVNAVYDDLTMGNGDWYNHYYNRYIFECITGLQIGWEKGPLQFNLGNQNPADEYIEAYWQQCYRSINRANSIMEIAGKIQDPANTDKIQRLKAEAQFLRGFYYLELVKYFDNVPLATASTKSYKDLPTNAGGKAKVLELIYEDATASAAVLPASYTGSDVGRATKWAAKTLLLKAQLFGEKWTEAKATADDIIATSGITLFVNFVNNFDVDNKNSGERIFEGQVSAAANANEYSNHSAHFNPEDYPSELGGAGWSWISSTKQFRMSYASKDKRIDATFIESYPTARLGKVNGQFPVVTWSSSAEYNVSRFGGIVKADANPLDPAQLIFGKAWSGKLVELGRSWTNTEKNTIYMRYADVLLSHSEACNESGQGDPYFGINQVRSRAGIPLLSGLNQATLRDAIVNERIHEFIFEQELYPELRRKSKFGGSPDYLGDQIKNYSKLYSMDRVPKATDYVLPIPLKELQGNPNVKQNPAWQ
jgi:hypothetical protein